MEIYRNSIAKINLDHWAHNIELLQHSFRDAPLLCPMIKADAYGHGDVQLARVLEDLGIQDMGVCLLEEGLKLRQQGVKNNILVFRSFDARGAKALLEANLTPVVSDWTQLHSLAQVASRDINFHLKFDTGMNRLGFAESEIPKIKNFLKQHSRLRPMAILTHLFNGEDAWRDEGRSVEQLNRIAEIAQAFAEYNVYVHALNSAGCVSKMKLTAEGVTSHPLMNYNWGARPGIMTYGAHPIPRDFPLDLKPVMSFRTEVCVVRTLHAGETVSYSGTFTATKKTHIVVVPVGYADGYHRLLSNRGMALLKGKIIPGVGNVCMDYMMFDATDLIESGIVSSPEELMGQPVTLFGEDENGQVLSTNDLANKAQTISYEIMTSVSSRVPREYVSNRFTNWNTK